MVHKFWSPYINLSIFLLLVALDIDMVPLHIDHCVFFIFFCDRPLCFLLYMNRPKVM
jgi:hypothetical protein